MNYIPGATSVTTITGVGNIDATAQIESGTNALDTIPGESHASSPLALYTNLKQQ
jgi:hypothetical protein